MDILKGLKLTLAPTYRKDVGGDSILAKTKNVNSPGAVTAGRDVHFNQPASAPEEHPYVDISLAQTQSNGNEYRAFLDLQNMSKQAAVLQAVLLGDVTVVINKVTLAPDTKRRIEVNIPIGSQLFSDRTFDSPKAEVKYKDIYGNLHTSQADIVREPRADGRFNVADIHNSRYIRANR